MSLYVQAPGGSLKYTFEWSDSIPSGVTLQDVQYQLGALTDDGHVIDNAGQTSTIQLSGIANGGAYVLTATATLSNGEKLPSQDLVIRGFGSA